MKLFAYGALMSSTHLKRLEISPKIRMPAILEGYALRFEKRQSHNPYYGAANIQKSFPTSRVFGIVFDFSENDIRIIDEREEYPTGYTREVVTVKLLSGEDLEVQTYVAHPDKIANNLLPTKGYIDLITESTDILPEEYIQLLREMETLPDHLDSNTLVEYNDEEVKK